MEEKSIMENDGNKKLILTYDAPFLNSDCIFVEYDDVIKSPFFCFLHFIANNSEALSVIFDLSEIRGLSIEELYEWYINREEKNILLNFPVYDEAIEELFRGNIEAVISWTQDLLFKELDSIGYFVKQDSHLNFHDTLLTLMDKSIVKKIYIYGEIYSKSIEKDIEIMYDGKAKYVYGDLVKVLKENEITSNSTFVFSDITKINSLKEAGILNLSSVIIADRYGYNYGGENEVVIDLEKYLSEDTFKLDFFDNLNSLEIDD